MKIFVCNNYESMSKKAANLVMEVVKQNPNPVLGLSTGGTPLGLYKELVNLYEKGELDFSNTVSFNLDEYFPIDPGDKNSYNYYMEQNLFSKVNMKASFVPNGKVSDPEVECADYERKIQKYGGIDLQVLGIGGNAHIGFNEPAAELNRYTFVTDLDQNTIKANSIYFENIEEMPKKALTMGMTSIFSAKKIILLASGESKSQAVKNMVYGKITTMIPASILALHSDVVVILDKEAAKFLEEGDYEHCYDINQ